MKRAVSVADFKSRLSEYLRMVKAGHEVMVTERGVPIARVLPLDETDRRSTRRMRLSRIGALKPGHQKLPKLLQQAPHGISVGADVLAALLAERGEGER